MHQEAEPKSLPPQEATEAPKPIVRHRQWGGASLGLMAGVGGLIAGRLGYLYPHFDVFAQFGAQSLALAFAFVCAVFMPRYKSLFGVVLFLLLLLAYGIWPHVVSRQLQPPHMVGAAHERVLRVAHFNSLATNLRYDEIASEIIRLNADVVSLVEVEEPKSKALDAYLAPVYPYRLMCSDHTWCEVSIVSKYPITNPRGLALWKGPPFALVELGGEMAGVTFIGTHTTRFPHSRAQLKQVMALAGLVETITGPVIVAGDFNTTPYSRVATSFENSANLRRLTSLPTWPAKLQLPQLAIDHIFASPDVRVLAPEQIGNNVGSDHYPILMTLGIPAK